MPHLWLPFLIVTNKGFLFGKHFEFFTCRTFKFNVLHCSIILFAALQIHFRILKGVRGGTVSRTNRGRRDKSMAVTWILTTNMLVQRSTADSSGEKQMNGFKEWFVWVWSFLTKNAVNLRWNKFHITLQGLNYATGKIQQGCLLWFAERLFLYYLNNLIKYTIMLIHVPVLQSRNCPLDNEVGRPIWERY